MIIAEVYLCDFRPVSRASVFQIKRDLNRSCQIPRSRRNQEILIGESRVRKTKSERKSGLSGGTIKITIAEEDTFRVLDLIRTFHCIVVIESRIVFPVSFK